MAAVYGEVFNREKDGYSSDFLDDSALIKAFDNAINPIKAMMGETHGAGTSAAATSSSKAKKKSQKRNSGKSKRKDELRSTSAVNGVGQKSSEWQVGSRCRAVYSADGAPYDAVIVSVDSEDGTCTVRYSYYNNEEMQRLDDLMPPSSDVSASVRHSCGNSARSDAGSCASVDSTPSGRGASLLQNACHHHHHHPQQHHQRSCHTSTRKARRQFRPVPPFPPLGRSFPPPPGMMPPFLHPSMMPPQPPHPVKSCPIFPPPPPPSVAAGDSDKQKESLYSLLISWYMCGYYTGLYQGSSSSSRGGAADSTVTGTTSEDADDSCTHDHIH